MTTSENKRFKSNPGTLEVAASAGVALAVDTSGAPKVTEYQVGPWHKTVIEVQKLTWATTTANLGVGQKIYTFPLGVIQPIWASINMTTTYGAGTSSAAGEVGLGTVLATGAVATLSTATWDDILNGHTVENQVASTALVEKTFGACGGTAGSNVSHDGTTTAVAVHLNHATANTGTGGATLNSAVVTLIWLDCGDVW